MTELEKAGLVGQEEKPENALPEEMLDPEFLESPIGKIFQALAGLEMAAKAFETRITQCEQYVIYLLAKDPHLGPKIAMMAKATADGKMKIEGDLGLTMNKSAIKLEKVEDAN